jgi:hypothetical protein
MRTSGAQGDSSGRRRLVSGSHGDRSKRLALLCIRSGPALFRTLDQG